MLFNLSNKLGLALGGGGVRGFAHLGVYKYLEEQNIKPDYISGTSAGAIVGAFLADGKSADETFEILTQKSLFEYSRMRFFKTGFIRLEGLKDDLKELNANNLEDLKTPLTVCVTNLNEGKVEYHNKGSLYKLVLASASIPVLFTPMEYNQTQYVDGGLFDNLPAEILKEDCNQIIGVNISPIQEEKDVDNFLKVAARTFQLSTHASTREGKEHCDIIIEPKKLNNFHILELDAAKEMFEIGYEAAQKTKIK